MLYRKGLLASGTPVTAYLAGQTEIKGEMAPCAGCHGLDGRGRPEGGVIPSSVRWQDLVRPYEVTAPTGRKHGPYTERSLVTAIALGLDPAGNKLHAVMPRFALPRPDADDLIAYLKKLADDYDPGVTDDRIRIGTLLPAEKSFPGMAQTVRAAVTAVFEDVNRAGGLYGRRIELVVRELPGQRSEAGAAYLEVPRNGERLRVGEQFPRGSRRSGDGSDRGPAGPRSWRADAAAAHESLCLFSGWRVTGPGGSAGSLWRQTVRVGDGAYYSCERRSAFAGGTPERGSALAEREAGAAGIGGECRWGWPRS